MRTLKLLTTVLTFLAVFIINTQAQFYVKAGAGYGIFPINGFKYFENSYLSGGEFYASDTTQTPVEKSWGTGLQTSIGIGYIISKNVSLELNGSYLSGTSLEPAQPNRTQKFKSTGIYIIPAVKFMVPQNNIIPYIRTGIIFALPKIEQEETRTSKTGTYNRTIQGGIALGFETSIGMDIKINNKFNVYAEFFNTALSWKPNEYEVTQNYIGETTGTTEYTERTQPYERFSTLGIKSGISYMFGKLSK